MGRRRFSGPGKPDGGIGTGITGRSCQTLELAATLSRFRPPAGPAARLVGRAALHGWSAPALCWIHFMTGGGMVQVSAPVVSLWMGWLRGGFGDESPETTQ